VWDLEARLRVGQGGAGWGADQLVDIDRTAGGLCVALPFSVLELVETLITRSVDAVIFVYKADASGVFSKEPWFKRKLEIAISFETGRPKGFVPSGSFDMNGDGFDDLITPGDGDSVEVWLGGVEASRPISRAAGSCRERTRTRRRRNSDESRISLYDPRLPRTPVVIATNRGLLPGTLPHISSNAREVHALSGRPSG
jgi:hypothetical protein